MPISNKNVGINIANLRASKHMTQQQLAAALGVSHQAVSKWENGSALPDLETLLNLSRLFGVTMEQLLSKPEHDEVKEDEPVSAGFDMDSVLDGLREVADQTMQTAKGLGSILVKKVNRVIEEANNAKSKSTEEATQETEASEGEGFTLSPEALVQLAPFMSREKVSSIVLGYDEEISLDTLFRLAPFMSQDALGKKVSAITKDMLTADVIVNFAPFLKQDMLFKLILLNLDKLDLAALKKLVPFLKKNMVDSLVDTICGVRRAVEADSIADFADKTIKGVGDFFGKIIENLSNTGAGKAKDEATETPDDDEDSSVDICEEDDGTEESVTDEPVIETELSEKDKLGRAALEGRSWNWIRLNLHELSDGRLLTDIILTASKELSEDEARDMLLNTAPYLDAASFKALVGALAADGQWDRICDLCPLADEEASGDILKIAALGGKRALDTVRMFAPKASKSVWDEVSQRAISNGEWELVNALTENIEA